MTNAKAENRHTQLTEAYDASYFVHVILIMLVTSDVVL